MAKEIVKDSTPLPQPLEYEDIDKEFNKWVKEDLLIHFEGEKLPTDCDLLICEKINLKTLSL